MSMQDYESAVALIGESGNGDFDGEKDSALIAKAEAVLGTTFPRTYRRFLAELGCGDIGGEEFYGIIGDNLRDSSAPNGIWLTLHERSSMNLDHRYIIVGAGGDGTYLAIDRGVSIGEESPIVRLSVDAFSAEHIAEDFGAHFLATVQSVV